MATEPPRSEANRLYWESDASVAKIAGRLGVSRRTLYELLQPFPAGARCAACAADLVFLNRLARSAGRAHCLACDIDRDVAELRRITADAGSALRERTAPGHPAPRAPQAPPEAREEPTDAARRAPVDGSAGLHGERLAGLVAAAGAGVLLGIVLTLLVRRRH